MMHSVQQFYDDNMDVRVKMWEHLIPTLEDQRNDGNIFFLMNQLFTFPAS